MSTAANDWRGQATYWRLMATGTLSLAKLLITSTGDFKRLRQTQASEEHYVRPPRCYDLPPFEPGMQSLASASRYLRATRDCNPHAPEVVAMARHLGAGRLAPRDYVDAAFQFAKEKLYLEILPIDSVEETLRRGTGTCFHLISVFIALCRAAGIPARYKIFAMNTIDAWRESIIDPDPLVKKWYGALGYFLLEGEGEALIDGQWTVAHVGPTAERQAAAGLPVTRLGEDAIGIWFMAKPGTLMRLEALPLGLGGASRFLWRLAPGSMERVSISMMHQQERGAAVLAAAGGREAYDARVRGALGLDLPRVPMAAPSGLVFVD